MAFVPQGVSDSERWLVSFPLQKSRRKNKTLSVVMAGPQPRPLCCVCGSEWPFQAETLWPQPGDARISEVTPRRAYQGWWYMLITPTFRRWRQEDREPKGQPGLQEALSQNEIKLLLFFFFLSFPFFEVLFFEAGSPAGIFAGGVLAERLLPLCVLGLKVWATTLSK